MLSRLLLARPHGRILPVLGQKVAMPAALDDSAFIQDQNLVGIDDGR